MNGEKASRPSKSDQIPEYVRQRIQNLEYNAQVMEARGAGDLAARILKQQTKFMESPDDVEEEEQGNKVHFYSHYVA